MAPNGGGVNNKNNNGTSLSRNHIGGGGGTRQVLKKGPWTTTEDAILMEYVKKHGEGNWNAVQRNSGLIRCGKSCRLRWANHLRPHLSAFSLEERLIVELHAKLGNRGLMYGCSDIFNPSTAEPSSNIISHPYQFNNNPSSPFLTITNNNMNNQVKFFRDPCVSLSLTLASSMKNSQLPPMVAPVPNNFSQGYSSSMPMSQLQHNYPNFTTTTTPFSGISLNHNGLILGITTKEASLELGNQVDDDIMRFLDNFPLGVPVPDWCDDHQKHI
ncbi:hypothetical protein HAX54_034391 [Datura stramonium]|uniref:Uncharacterized protein n=1 Tax=Datura stramonium TaxID=4076 RepID=A0ABS8SEF2_DATST|nr:hypothetical protein [Datura stramonium]